MKLTPHINEKDMDQLRTEQVQKKKNEFHLIGQERRIKGHTLFCFNLVTREIKVAAMNQEIELGLDGSVIYKNNIIVEELSKVIPQDEEYLRLVQRHKELSDYIAKAIGGRNHVEKVKGYTKEYTKILEE